MALATGPSAPQWELREPGRLKWELEWLRYFRVNPEIDETALKSRAIWLHFDWMIDGEAVSLTARFPDSYPRMRPRVSLRGERVAHQRHVNPFEDGDICLLGRDSRQWPPDLGLGRLLDLQLADALKNTGDQDPQGEPDEYWWNLIGVAKSFIVVDSSWVFNEYASGFLSIRVAFESDPTTRLRGWVRKIQTPQRQEICRWSGPPPFQFKGSTIDLAVPWIRAVSPIRPNQTFAELKNYLNSVESFEQQPGRPFAPKFYGQLLAIVYPMERTVDEVGDGWLFPLWIGAPEAFVGKKDKPKEMRIIPTYRGSATDIGWRVPAVGHLRKSKIAVVGVGAIGAPLTLELARNGCGNIRAVDHDKVEPGNSIRWPLGASVWGESKVNGLHELVKSDYPWCNFQPISRQLGDVALDGDRDQATLSLLEGVDLVIDAAASFGVSTTLNDWARDQKIPMISLSATPTVEGGIVVHYAPGGACPTCLEYYHKTGGIQTPPGQGKEGELAQPPGCAERTFTGSSTDLQEISLQAVRVVVEVTEKPSAESFVLTLALADDSGATIPPSWRADPMPIHPSCTCPH